VSASRALLAAFVAWALRRGGAALVDLRLLRTGRVGRVLAGLFLSAVVMGGSSLGFTRYLQEVQGLTPLRAAWWTLPQMVLMIVSANAGPWLTRRLSPRTATTTMLAIMGLGFLLYTLTPATRMGLPMASAAVALTAFGIGGIFPQLMDGVISSAPPERAGAGAAMAQLCNELGIAVGLSVLGSLATVVYRGRLNRPGTTAAVNVVDGVSDATARADGVLLAAVRAAFTDAFHAVGLASLLALAVVALLLRTRRRA